MDNYQIKTGPESMDIACIHQFLSEESYWAAGMPLETLEKALQHSYCAGVFYAGQQVGFARLVTDYATFAYLADVFVVKPFRGKGISKILIKHLLGLDWVQRLRRIMLATLDAHRLYQAFGFTSPEQPENLLEIRRKNIYGEQTPSGENTPGAGLPDGP